MHRIKIKRCSFTQCQTKHGLASYLNQPCCCPVISVHKQSLSGLHVLELTHTTHAHKHTHTYKHTHTSTFHPPCQVQTSAQIHSNTNLLAELVQAVSQNDTFSCLHRTVTDHAVKVLSIGVKRCVISLHEGSIVLVPLLQLLLLFLLQKLDTQGLQSDNCWHDGLRGGGGGLVYYLASSYHTCLEFIFKSIDVGSLEHS